MKKTYEQVLEEEGYLYWKIVGISMRPMIKEESDTVIIRKRPEGRLKKYDVVLFRRNTANKAYVLHRILKVNSDNTYWIVGDNCCTGETVNDKDVFGILESVVGKDGEKKKLKGLGYWLYIHLWCNWYPVRFFIIRYKSYPRRAASKLLRKLKIKK